jgi:hypothetical protein
MGFVHSWIGVQPRVSHDPVNEIVDHAGNAINSPEPFVERWLARLFVLLNPRLARGPNFIRLC